MNRANYDHLHFPLAQDVQAHPQIWSSFDVRSIYDSLNLDLLYRDIATITDFDPGLSPMNVEMFADPNPVCDTGSISCQRQYDTGYDPQEQRGWIRVKSVGDYTWLRVNCITALREAYELQGILGHELGHLFTGRIIKLKKGGTLAYLEAFAEIFRSVLAEYRGADWEQNMGGQDYQVLAGPSHPKLVLPNDSYPSENLNYVHSVKNIVCTRLKELFGGFTDRVMHGIAVACHHGASRDDDTLEVILADIERETGVKGFANDVLNDEITKPGNAETGVYAHAFINRDRTALRLTCFDLLDTVDKFQFTRQTFTNPDECRTPPITNEHFFLDPNERPLDFQIRVSHPALQNLKIDRSGTGEAVITPRDIMTWSAHMNLAWPAGETAIYFKLQSEDKGTMLREALHISEDERLRICHQLGIAPSDPVQREREILAAANYIPPQETTRSTKRQLLNRKKKEQKKKRKEKDAKKKKKQNRKKN